MSLANLQSRLSQLALQGSLPTPAPPPPLAAAFLLPQLPPQQPTFNLSACSVKIRVAPYF